jgi:hypothetical protein
MDLDVLDAIRDRVREHRVRHGPLRRVLDQPASISAHVRFEAPRSVAVRSSASSISPSSASSHHPDVLENPAGPQANCGSMKLPAPR